MTTEELARSYTGSEREYIESLATFAKDHGRPIESVLVEAVIDRHRDAIANAQAFEAASQSVRRLSAELWAAKKAA